MELQIKQGKDGRYRFSGPGNCINGGVRGFDTAQEARQAAERLIEQIRSEGLSISGA